MLTSKWWCRLFGHRWEKRPYDPDDPPNDSGLFVCKRCSKIGPEWDDSDL